MYIEVICASVSAIKNFLIKPNEILYKPVCRDFIFTTFALRPFLNVVISTIGPANNCGKKVRNVKISNPLSEFSTLFLSK